MKEKPEFLLTYKCNACGELSRFVETEEPHCRYCEENAGLEMVLQQVITPELMEEQLKASMDRMFKNLQSAFASMTEEDKAAFGSDDGEKEMLLLLAKAQKLKEQIDGLDFKRDT
jgi:hypothetical protein